MFNQFFEKKKPRIRIRAERRGEYIIFEHNGVRENTLAITFTISSGENLSGEAFGRTYILDTFVFKREGDALKAITQLARYGLIALLMKE